MRHVLWFAIGLLLAPAALAADSNPVRVMVLGTFHLDNPGQDLNNIRAVDVLTPQRQAELADVTHALARFQPTLIAVERVTAAPDYLDPVYAKFDPSQLAGSPDERVQIGYRLAHETGLRTVRGIDEQPAAGEPDYFPFERVQASAKAHGEEPQLQAILDETGRMVAGFEKRQAASSMSELLVEANNPRTLADASMYYRLLSLDSGEDQPGAELFGYWTMRNARIFAKLMDVTRPGDRVVVIFGAGHKHWLEQLVANTPGYAVVDPVPYLNH
jgi:hypothetical protein